MTSTDPGAPLRPTRQRTAVTEALATFDDFRSAQQIHDLLAGRGAAISMAAVGKPEENGFAERLMRTIKEEEV